MLEEAYYNEMLDRVENSIIRNAVVTEADIKETYYEYVQNDRETYNDDIGTYEYLTQYENTTIYYVPDGYRGISLLLLEVDEELLEKHQKALEKSGTNGSQTMSAKQKILDSVQPTIDRIYYDLEMGNSSFRDLILQYGCDPSMAEEPTLSLGYNVHKDSIIWDPAFVEASFSINRLMEVSAPFVGQYGVYIVQYVRDVPFGPVEFTKEIQASLYDDTLSRKQNDMFNETMEQWMNESVILYAPEAQKIMEK